MMDNTNYGDKIMMMYYYKKSKQLEKKYKKKVLFEDGEIKFESIDQNAIRRTRLLRLRLRRIQMNHDQETGEEIPFISLRSRSYNDQQSETIDVGSYSEVIGGSNGAVDLLSEPTEPPRMRFQDIVLSQGSSAHNSNGFIESPRIVYQS